MRGQWSTRAGRRRYAAEEKQIRSAETAIRDNTSSTIKGKMRQIEVREEGLVRRHKFSDAAQEKDGLQERATKSH